MRAQPDFANRYRFGTVKIRGHRCIRQIGSGGMCTIYLAESERAGTMVVLKVFNQVPDVSERIVGFDRFLQEYEIVAGLKHQNIVRIYDLGIADDHAYIAMEHFPGGDLRQRMKVSLLPQTALEYVEQIASALDAIHSVGVLHRDLKPANVMLRSDGSLCLIDFGLAKANEMEVSLTGTRENLRHAVLHEPGTGPRRGNRRAQRLVQPGRHVLRDAHRQQALHRRDGDGSHLQAQAGGTARDCAPVRGTRAYSAPPASQVAGRPLSIGPRAARGDRGAQDPGVSTAFSEAPAFVHPLLRAATPAAWIERARASPDVLLIDHANCEKKAASTALALMFAYAEDLELTDKMSRLAREELRHYEQVAKLIRALNVVPQRLAPGRYAERLRRLVARSEPRREVDLMICGAIIEARSCERFALLAENLGAPLSGLFQGLHNAEARHYRVYLDLAKRAAKRAGHRVGTETRRVRGAGSRPGHGARCGVSFSLRSALKTLPAPGAG